MENRLLITEFLRVSNKENNTSTLRLNRIASIIITDEEVGCGFEELLRNKIENEVSDTYKILKDIIGLNSRDRKVVEITFSGRTINNIKYNYDQIINFANKILLDINKNCIKN